MAQVTPGIYWIKIPIGMEDSSLTHVNAYLVDGEDGYLLVDSGWNTPESFDALQKELSSIGADIGDISQIVVTHVHPDHYGMAGRIKELSGATLYLHEIEKQFIEPRYSNMESLLNMTADWLRTNGVPPDETGEIRNASLEIVDLVVPTPPDIVLHGDETISTGKFTFRVLWTPGHSSGHVCLYEPEKKVFISGDHILPTITPNIGMHPQSVENPLGSYIDSLSRIMKLDTEIVLPGHDEPFRELVPRIKEIIRHHGQRNQEILKTVASEPKTAYRIAGDVTWATSARWQDLPLIHKRMAIFETLSHLEFMVARRKISKTSKDGIIYYRQT
jgi:glyoxylase-like metal-dependent hydrolase (beta-lactamase superfamily II)